VLFASFFTLAMIAYAAFVFGHFSTCFVLEGGPNALGLSFGYSYTEALTFFELRNDDQILCYRNFILIWDNIFPLIYGLMYFGWFSVLFKNKWIIVALPILRSAADWVENIIEIAITDQFRTVGTITEELVIWGSASSIFKWGLSIVVYGVIVYGVTLAILRKQRG